jgi:hypothetical protein
MTDKLFKFVILPVCVVSVTAGLVGLFRWSEEQSKQFQEKKRAAFTECLSLTNQNVSWCYEHLVK